MNKYTGVGMKCEDFFLSNLASTREEALSNQVDKMNHPFVITSLNHWPPWNQHDCVIGTVIPFSDFHVEFLTPSTLKCDLIWK